jgi:dTDP-4-dehydrorhamnose reductase
VEICADLTDAEQVCAALDAVVPEVIVNLAALTNVDECERNPQLAYLENVRIVENLAKWIQKKANACHLVQLSTDQVYDGVGPHKEGNINLTNYYGFSKYAGELAAATVSSTVLRTNFFGQSQCSVRTSLSDWLVQALTKGESITVFDDVRFSPLNLAYLVEMIELVVVKRQQGIFNLGSKDGISKSDFAFLLAEGLSLSTQNIKRGKTIDANLVAYRPNDMCMDSSNFERVFGVELPTVIKGIQLLTRRMQ